MTIIDNVYNNQNNTKETRIGQFYLNDLTDIVNSLIDGAKRSLATEKKINKEKKNELKRTINDLQLIILMDHCHISSTI